MKATEQKASLSSLCGLLGHSRQALYQHRQTVATEALQSELILQQVARHRRLQPRLGTRKLLVLLRDFLVQHQLQWGRDALFGLLRQHGLLVKRHRRRTKTTHSSHWLRKYPNLIKDWEPVAPNTLWVSDITYIRCADGFAYLSLITDAYSHQIAGYCLSETLAAGGCIEALQMALQSCENSSGLIHHSDRGVQYCSEAYVSLLNNSNIRIRMTENGDPLENAIAERVNGILKDELLQQRYADMESGQSGVATAIEVYNTLRPHGSCDMLTPQQAHQRTGPLKKHWKNYYQPAKQKEAAMTDSG